MSEESEKLWRATVVLRHEAPQGVHFDWLLDPPPEHALPEERLWAVRVAMPPEQWLQEREFEVWELPPHRRLYLEYEGELSGGRGAVRRVAKGLFDARLWSGERKDLVVRIQGWELGAVLTRVQGDRWRLEIRPDNAINMGS